MQRRALRRALRRWGLKLGRFSPRWLATLGPEPGRIYRSSAFFARWSICWVVVWVGNPRGGQFLDFFLHASDRKIYSHRNGSGISSQNGSNYMANHPRSNIVTWLIIPKTAFGAQLRSPTSVFSLRGGWFQVHHPIQRAAHRYLAAELLGASATLF